MAEKQAETPLQEMPAAELQSQLVKLRQELWHNRLKTRDGSLQQTHLLSDARRQIARVQTALRNAAAQETPKKPETQKKAS